MEIDFSKIAFPPSPRPLLNVHYSFCPSVFHTTTSIELCALWSSPPPPPTSIPLPIFHFLYPRSPSLPKPSFPHIIIRFLLIPHTLSLSSFFSPYPLLPPHPQSGHTIHLNPPNLPTPNSPLQPLLLPSSLAPLPLQPVLLFLLIRLSIDFQEMIYHNQQHR